MPRWPPWREACTARRAPRRRLFRRSVFWSFIHVSDSATSLAVYATQETYGRIMGYGIFLLIVIAYVFGVGHFNFTVGLASGLVMLVAFHKHDGELLDEL